MNPPVGMNRDVREYARKPECWQNIQKANIQWSSKLENYLISASEYNKLEKAENSTPSWQKAFKNVESKLIENAEKDKTSPT